MNGPITSLDEADLEEHFTRAAGPGGQNVNKVATRVTLRHRPTNLTVHVQDSRSQAFNRRLARERLLAALQAREREAISSARNARERERRRNAPRPPGLKRRILEAKRHRSRLKEQRRVSGD
jgi:protein subunit release factor B